MKKQKEKKEQKKGMFPIYLLAGLVGYALIIIIIVILTSSGKKDKIVEKGNYLFVNGETFLEYKNGKLKTINFVEKSYPDKFTVYEDYKYNGQYFFSPGASEYKFLVFLNKTKTSRIVPREPYVAYTDFLINREIMQEDLDESDYSSINSLLITKGMELEKSNLLKSYKIVYDVDDDKEMETIYVVNSINFQNPDDNIFSLVYVEDGTERKIIEEYYFNSETYMEFVFVEVNYIFRFKEDKRTAFVISSSDDDVTLHNFYAKKKSYYEKINEDY